MFGVSLKLHRHCAVFTGWGVQSYAFRTTEDAQAFIDENWADRTPGWRKRHLIVKPLLPVTAINPSAYLLMEKPQ